MTVVTVEMVKRAREAYRKNTGAEDYQLDGWIDGALYDALAAALFPAPEAQREDTAPVQTHAPRSDLRGND